MGYELIIRMQTHMAMYLNSFFFFFFLGSRVSHQISRMMNNPSTDRMMNHPINDRILNHPNNERLFHGESPPQQLQSPPGSPPIQPMPMNIDSNRSSIQFYNQGTVGIQTSFLLKIMPHLNTIICVLLKEGFIELFTCLHKRDLVVPSNKNH